MYLLNKRKEVYRYWGYMGAVFASAPDVFDFLTTGASALSIVCIRRYTWLALLQGWRCSSRHGSSAALPERHTHRIPFISP